LLTEKACPPARQLSKARLFHPVSRNVLDTAMVVQFPAPHSYTGEDVVEFHVHGGAAVIRAVLNAVRQVIK